MHYRGWRIIKYKWSINNAHYVYLEERLCVFLKPFKWFAEFFSGQLAHPRTVELSSLRCVRLVSSTDKLSGQSKPGEIYEFPFRDRVNKEEL